MSEGHLHPDVPPSAAGASEPYGIQVRLGAAEEGFSPRGLLETLLLEVAKGCESEGATLIGHIKCFLSDGERGLFANLVSTRTGVVCRGDEKARLTCAHGCRLDLAVLVYGLPAPAVDRIVRETLDRLLAAEGVPLNPEQE